MVALNGSVSELGPQEHVVAGRVAKDSASAIKDKVGALPEPTTHATNAMHGKSAQVWLKASIIDTTLFIKTLDF